MKVKLIIYGFKSWLGPIGANSVVDTVEGEISPEVLKKIKTLIRKPDA